MAWFGTRWFGDQWFGPQWFGDGEGTPAAAVTTTTVENLRDHIIALIAAITPLTHSRDRFIPYRNEGGADFQRWAEGLEGGAAFRRFQVRDTGRSPGPDITNTDVESRFVVFEILIAYPQSSRWGKKAALDRDDAANIDQHEIDRTVGLNGYANFTTAFVPATWVGGGIEDRIIGEGVDFVRITQEMRFFRRMYP